MHAILFEETLKGVHVLIGDLKISYVQKNFVQFKFTNA